MRTDDEPTTARKRKAKIVAALFWTVVVPLGLGVGIAEGRIRLNDHEVRHVALDAPSTTDAPTLLVATTTTIGSQFTPGTPPPSSARVTIAPAIGNSTLAREVVWYQLADCESGAWSGGIPLTGSARWDVVARGYQGGLQFHPVTWDRFRSKADPPEANLATSVQQIAVAEKVLSREGVGAWPTCGPRVGLARLVTPGHEPVTSSDLLPAAEPTVLDDE
jgi:hypothetical protein